MCVAANSSLPVTTRRDALDRLLASARANGVALDPIDRAAAAQREPDVAPAHAAWSPETGWIDTDAYIRTLTAQLDRLGGVLLVGTPLVAVEPHGDGVTIVTPRERIQADAVVNAAGLYADEVSRLGGGESFQIYPCRGEYAELAPRARGLVRGLVYPVPHPSGHGLGVHLTRTLGGAVWIGPTIRYQEGKADYEDESPAPGRLPRAHPSAVTVDHPRRPPPRRQRHPAQAPSGQANGSLIS